MANNIAFSRNYTAIIDEVYQRAGVSNVLNSGRRMMRAGHNAKEILIPKISVTGLGDYTRNVGYKTGSITYEFETKTFNYDRGIRLFADVMDTDNVNASSRIPKDRILVILREWHPVPAMTQCMDCPRSCVTFRRLVSPAPGAGGQASDLIGARRTATRQHRVNGSTAPSVSCPAWPSCTRKPAGEHERKVQNGGEGGVCRDRHAQGRAHARGP